VRTFILKYPDRIQYGSDLSFDIETRRKERAAEKLGGSVTARLGYFSTDDTFDYHRHRIEGLNLPLPVLKLYHDNAMRWIPGTDTLAH